MNRKYILNGKIAVPCDDPIAWAEFFETADRRVALTNILDKASVSTVFLGIDHNWGDGPPHLFETMIFGEDGGEEWCERCATWEEAEAQHKRACDHARGRSGI